MINYYHIMTYNKIMKIKFELFSLFIYLFNLHEKIKKWKKKSKLRILYQKKDSKKKKIFFFIRKYA